MSNFIPHYNGCNYLSMLGLKLNHVSKRGYSYPTHCYSNSRGNDNPRTIQDFIGSCLYRIGILNTIATTKAVRSTTSFYDPSPALIWLGCSAYEYLYKYLVTITVRFSVLNWTGVSLYAYLSQQFSNAPKQTSLPLCIFCAASGV